MPQCSRRYSLFTAITAMARPMNKSTRFYCGTSNVELPVPNKTHFPPEYQDKSRLCYYASLYNTVEINSSFYKIPLPRTVARWATEVPDDFRFTFKLWKGITHARELIYDAADIERFFTAIDSVGDKKGCLLIQFPASIKASLFQSFRGLMDDVHSVSEGSGWKIAVEFRDRSWYCDNVYQLLEQYRTAVVVHDMPASATPLIDMDAGFVYLRFHGEKGDYRGSYEEDFLHEYAGYIHDWVAEGKHVYAYFNNTIGGAVANAQMLQELYDNGA